jgi:hypothetical protein
MYEHRETRRSLAYVGICLVGFLGNRAEAQIEAKFTRQSDVIYGRKYGELGTQILGKVLMYDSMQRFLKAGR